MSRLTNKNSLIQLQNLRKNYKDFIFSSEQLIYEKLGTIEDLLDLYSIKTLVDLNVILAEYFCEVKDHTFKIKE